MILQSFPFAFCHKQRKQLRVCRDKLNHFKQSCLFQNIFPEVNTLKCAAGCSHHKNRKSQLFHIWLERKKEKKNRSV